MPGGASKTEMEEPNEQPDRGHRPALASEPRLLILDDPTLGLDPVARRAVFEELIGDLADRGTAVFLTSHDLSGVEGSPTASGFSATGGLFSMKRWRP